MTGAPPLPKHPTERDYRARDVQWHLRELGDIIRSGGNGVKINVRANLGRAVQKREAST